MGVARQILGATLIRDQLCELFFGRHTRMGSDATFDNLLGAITFARTHDLTSAHRIHCMQRRPDGRFAKAGTISMVGYSFRVQSGTEMLTLEYESAAIVLEWFRTLTYFPTRFDVYLNKAWRVT